MPDFQVIRDQLQQGRKAQEQARQDLFATGQQLRLLQQERAALERSKGANNPQYDQRRDDLDQRIAAAQTLRDQQQQTATGLRDQLINIENQFDLFIDPRTELTDHFSNNTPFLLFPLRLETRFKMVGNQPQLWVRVYPDECLVDSFEPLLSKKEVNNAARFWAEYYSAGEIADPAHPDPAVVELQKAAWRLLVGAHGDGRSAWITRQLQPAAGSVFPVRAVNTHILVIVAATWEADPAKQAAIYDLIGKSWRANGNAASLAQIATDFETAHPGMQAADILTTYLPVNFGESPQQGIKREDAVLAFAVVLFEGLDSKTGKEHSWSQPTKVNLLPERLALIRVLNGKKLDPVFGRSIPHPLPTSPDPSAAEGEQFSQTPEGDLAFEESIRWVSDFDKAVEIGMGFRLDLEPGHVNGFDELYVLGVRLSADAVTAKQELSDLFDHHYYSKKGFSLIPQGTPTNNTEATDAGFTRGSNADATFEPYFKQTAAFSDTDDWMQKRDGQWLAEYLGLDTTVFSKVLNSEGKDQADARNMNIALWPATLGYVMESLMKGGFTLETIDRTRAFFAAYVSGRGPVPAIRIGNQPYGILPTAAFHRLQWMHPKNQSGALANNKDNFLQRLYELLEQISADWSGMAKAVPQVTQQTNQPYQTLLDVVGLNANSVEYHRRYLEEVVLLRSYMWFLQPGIAGSVPIPETTLQLLQRLGYPQREIPEIAQLLGVPWQGAAKYLVDDVPLSETSTIGEYTTDKKDYITALIAQARKSADALRTGEGLAKRPATELYRLLKYALEQGYYDSALRLAADSNAYTPQKIAAMRVEQPVVHQQWQGELTESRYALLYNKIPQVSNTQTVSEMVREALLPGNLQLFARYLNDQLAALDLLKDASTARLERALVEHLDCCSYRLDAWKTGILHQQLGYMRGNLPGAAPQPGKGIFIGAYGMLQQVRPEKNKVLSVQNIPADLQQDFNADGKQVLLKDAANEGFIHAPSLNQAVTAAVLRNGFLSHGKPDENNVLAVNLSSERIRLALSVIEGIQGGQSLAALLGYQLERTLHDRDDLLNAHIDTYIYAIRKQFPLSANQIQETSTGNNTDPSVDAQTVPVTAIEARNVVHGVNLVKHVKKQTAANQAYPFGLPLPAAGAAVVAAITDAVNAIADIADAVADLGMAESVHQVVMGNYDRAAGVLDAYSKGNYPQYPDVIHTPRSGATLTHRVGIPVTYVASAGISANPRAVAEPSLNNWLADILPPLDKVVCRCNYFSRADGSARQVWVSLQQLGLQPLDVLYILQTADDRSLTELDDRLQHYVYTHHDPLMDKPVTLAYTERPAAVGEVAVFEVMPLIGSLRAVLLESTPLRPGDLALPNEATQKDQPAPELNAGRVSALLTNLNNLLSNASSGTGVVAYLNALPDPSTAAPGVLDTIRLQAEDTLNRFAALLLELGTYGIPQTGFGTLYDQRRNLYLALQQKVQEAIDRWQLKSDTYNNLLTAHPAPDTEQLMKLERMIATTLTSPATITLPVVQAKKIAFDTEFVRLQDVQIDHHASLTALIQAIRAIQTTPYDRVGFDLETELYALQLMVYDLQKRAATFVTELNTKHIPAAQSLLNDVPTLSPDAQVKQTEAAARTILGEAFRMLPRYTLPAAQQAELSNAWQAEDILLDYLVNTKGNINPKEDWLHGIARVHEKMRHLENCLLLREAFSLTETALQLHAVQLPFKTSKYHWLAMPFPAADIDMEESNVLLYTAFAPVAAGASAEICGILADEWTEVIPYKEETTGIAFHYDRPNTEAPQTMLLVTPTQLTGNWQWDDLVDALLYTLEAAQARGIEPEQIDKTAYAGVLPAVIGAESRFPYSIVLDNMIHYIK